MSTANKVGNLENIDKIIHNTYGTLKKANWENRKIIVVLKNLNNSKISESEFIEFVAKLKVFHKIDHSNINHFFGLMREIPLEWKYANVYPIPKPKPWGCQLVNTCPITLLETARKLMVSIMNARLSTILQKNKILKGLQFAGLPFSSTFEPLRIINEIIQDANENDKELWILSLDISKAYDRVNIFMLKKAMQLLKIPSSFINLTKELFLGWKNSVFTAGGLSNPYDVMVGINQGEIISPLLWCIYYDPLLTAIQQEHFGYHVKAKKKINLYENIEVEVNQNITSMAYMDDTNMLAGNKEELEKILKTADDFYTLNDIQINKENLNCYLRKRILILMKK
ncbi:reverse transcriptase family protein [Rhizophagus irregularis DAOM 181602=DAOM 197198]|nr:reverse transcriptase family protein [Rhizophagus irregularis DAOM 181602=DAOM 197198]